MNISYRHLRAFIEVAHSTTFAEAAAKLHLTQPALSSSIKKMEQELGGKLFERNTRNVSLTPEGEILLPNALRLSRDWDNTFSDIQNLFAMAKGQLTISAMPSFAESHLPGLLSEFHHIAPNINLRVVDVVMEQVVQEIRNGRAEIGFTFEPEHKDGLIFDSLFTDRFVVVANKAQAARFNQKPSWRECLAFPLVMMNRGSAVRKWTEAELCRYGEPNIVAETGQLATLGKLIKSGLGISIMPSICKPQMEALGVKALEFVDSPLLKRVGLLRNERRGLSVSAQTLWKLTVSHYESSHYESSQYEHYDERTPTQ
ncbi:MAG: LysR family transcriptional regulator [Alteromonas sp.]|jgi:LysR family carnitine catabolism transcriptional activator|uniref:LysR family transcriptional regulator n=1 Tax=Alteromonas sp. RW2A1 TaxID=1917158 RepID=UPI000903B8FE|nr:LysR family transcriptional regulator [Alteromonas sp. RW2A1]APE05136.1 LysR family transcriptional regulator [Alteromonas sp. RW2A1]MAI65066.1 LysR family transcriptional regulator [Alteromonas sp.]